MTAAEQSGEPLRDYSSPATWGDVEQLRHSLGTQIDTQIADVKTQIATMETRIETRVAGMETRLETQIATMETERAKMETRLTRLFLGAVAGGVGAIGILVGILQAVD